MDTSCRPQYVGHRARAAAVAAAVIAVALSSPRVVAKAEQEPGSSGPAALAFTDITATAAANTMTGSHGAAWADVTGDGMPDLFLTYNECHSGTRRNRFYRNLGGGVFTEEALTRGLGYTSGGSHGATWADLDNDGHYDLVTGDTYLTDCKQGDPPAEANHVFQIEGSAFVDRTPAAMAATVGYTRSVVALDADRDGKLDIFAVNGDQGSLEPQPDRDEFYHNDGSFNFTSVTAGPIVDTPAGQAAAATDYDNDGDIDLLLPNTTGDLGVLRNDGGVFTSIPPASIGLFHRASEGISSGDLNNDGLFDLVLIDQDRNVNRPLGFDRVAFVYLNAGGGNFTYAGEIRHFGGYTAGLADIDNDGDLDITLPGLPYVLLNDGRSSFTPGPSYPTPTPDPACVLVQCMTPDPRTVAFADIDGDGDLDSVVTAKYGAFRIIRNDLGGGGNWLKVKLTSPEGQAGAFGAKVRLYRPGTTSLIAIREAKSEYGYLSQDDPVLHFGLGQVASVDVEVAFLDGTIVHRANVAVNQAIDFAGAAMTVAPAAPRNLTASVQGSRVTLTWSPPADGDPANGYRLDVGSRSGLSNLLELPVGSTTSFAASAPVGSYFARVLSEGADEVSAPSNEVVIAVGGSASGTCTRPAPPALAFNRTGSLVTLTWSRPDGAAPGTIAYVVEAGSRSGASDAVTIDTGAPVSTMTANAPPGRYFVRVRGRAACGTGAPSNELIIDVP